MYEILEKVNSPNELKQLSKSELVAYCNQARDFIVEKVTKTGGHLSSNLGAVELSVALHCVFDSPHDKILFDVGHQAYTHKLITGRRDLFDTLRHDDGMSGFPNAEESEHDHFTTGHSSNSLSLGLGLARGRDLLGENYKVISVIGDGAFTGGQAYEALCDIGAHKDKMLIVLNDNEMSISKNVGAFSEHLAKLRLSKKYSSLKFSVRRAVSGLPFFGDKLAKLLERAKNSVKSSLIANKIFENLGVKYYGPINGHDLGAMVDMLEKLKDFSGPALLHVVTEKGKGVDYVSKEPSKFHGVSPQGERKDISYASVVRNKMIELAKADEKVVAVTAAMANGTGLDAFAQAYHNRYFDVGIAEQHAVSMCAGLAKSGLKPYFAVYSSFLQRAFDQVIEDTGIDGQNVTYLIDHAGAVTGDGVTHQGLYDVALLNLLPNITIMQPKDGVELENMLDFSLKYDKLLAIRYSKSFAANYDKHEKIDDLSWETVKTGDSGVVILATGNKMLGIAENIENATVINARVIKPLDEKTLLEIKDAKLIVTLEDGVVSGGFGQMVENYYKNNECAVKVLNLGYPDRYLREYGEKEILSASELTVDKLTEKIKKHL